MRGSYALARVTVVRAAVARSLLCTGAAGALTGALVPALVPRTPAALAGTGLLAAAAVYGLLHRRTWWRTQAAAAQRAAFAVTVEPARLTRRRHLRDNGARVIGGLLLLLAAGFAAGPAAGMAVAGLGLGLLLSVARLARWERVHEVLLWAPTDSGWLLGRRRAAETWSTTGPSAGKVRPVVRPAGAAHR